MSERAVWDDTARLPLITRRPLPGSREVDVAIVGAGTTGLWTAYHLRSLDPTLRVAVIDRHHVGFGASGRNGGWCIGELAGTLGPLERASSVDAVRRLNRAVIDTVGRVGRIVADESIDCGWAPGGSVWLARNHGQLRRLDDIERAARHHGVRPDELQRLDAAEAGRRIGASSVHGGLWYAPCATVHPLDLTRGIARASERLGVEIFERTTALELGSGRVTTDRGTIRAEIVIRATEGYTASLRGDRRRLVPLASSMIATEPLPDELWRQLGLDRRETFNDVRHLVVYGQRTEDGRIVFGSRGAPYRWGSSTAPVANGSRRHHGEAGHYERIHQHLVDLFPSLADVAITHRWSGVLGVPRDWTPSVGLDRTTGLAWAGGFVGEGVAASHLAGETLADLVVGRRTELVDLPWVGHRSRRWAPEPFRWIGVNGALAAMAGADRSEFAHGRPSRAARLMWRFLAR